MITIATTLGMLGTAFIATSDAPAQPSALQTYAETLPNSVVKIQMIAVPGGSIKIGNKTITVKPFWIAQTETPWEAFDVFIASGEPSPAYDQTEFKADVVARPSKSYILPDLGWGHNGSPAINLSFTSVEMFCRWLAKATKKKYRVPTEAEWEWACRAGSLDAWNMDAAQLDKAAWYEANSRKMSHPVAKKEPNKYGINDMLGNVGEWSTDLEGKPVLCGSTFLDPANEVTPTRRQRWQPEWQDKDPQIPKSRWWLSDAPFAGFRIVCEP